MNSIIKNIIKTKKYFLTLLLGLTLFITVPFIFKNLIIPSFKTQLLSNISDEAKRVAQHLSTSIDFRKTSIEELNRIVNTELTEFQIHKIHFFEHDGTILYSTVPEKIGAMNSNDYFHNIVAKGKIYFKVKSKGSKSSEDEAIITDIIEIYVPIMKNGKFIEAVELYYDISQEIQSFRILSDKIMNITVALSVIGTISLLFILFIVSKSNIEIRKYQKELKELAHFDSLSGLYNRGYFFHLTSDVLKIEKRNHESMSIAMIDIDDFKNINDSFGHKYGDFIIKSLSEKLKELTRESDIVARYGGEEFIIMFPSTSIEGADEISRKICETIAKTEFSLDDIKISVTVSIGISEYEENQSIDEFIHTSDLALYNAKNLGKNRVEKIAKFKI